MVLANEILHQLHTQSMTFFSLGAGGGKRHPTRYFFDIFARHSLSRVRHAEQPNTVLIFNGYRYRAAGAGKLDGI